MTKALFFLLFLTVFSLAGLWFVENDGSVVVEWLGYRVQTSVAFAVLFIIIAIVAFSLLLQGVLWLKGAPGRYRSSRRQRQQTRGLTALTKGFAALYLGDIKQAKSLAAEADSNVNMPLTRLLAAQTAQLDGDRQLAQEHYNAMLGNKQTEIIAIKGLLMEAGRDNDLHKALFLAEKAYNLQSDAQWVILNLLELYKKLRKWEKASSLIQKAVKRKLITATMASHILGLIALARYQLLPRQDNNAAYELIKTAYKLIPEFAPVVSAYGCYLYNCGKNRKAIKILENQWIKNPHPDIAAAYMAIFADNSREVILAKAEKLLHLCNNNIAGHIIMAENLLAARELGKARQHLTIALKSGESKVICQLMAELESMSHAEPQIIDYWRQQATLDGNLFLWQCSECGNKTHKWTINCNECNNFDSFKWQDGQGQIEVARPKKLGFGWV